VGATNINFMGSQEGNPDGFGYTRVYSNDDDDDDDSWILFVKRLVAKP
jgi:hypothetical protein